VKPVLILFIALGVLVIAFVALWIAAARRSARRDSEGRRKWPDAVQILIGFVVNFFDTLGIGNFATTTSVFKLRKMVPDELMPGTLNVGHTLPVVTEALIYISIIEVDTMTLITMIAASVIGAWFGAPIVASWPRRAIQIGLGSVLVAAAALMLASQLQLLPIGGESLKLGGVGLGVGIFGSFWLGALMTLGLGYYAPCMILVSMLGLNPKAAFPIMMGACAFLMPVASMQFVRREKYSLRPALGLTLGGIPGVLLAAFVVTSLPLDYVRWLVVCVVIYAASAMLHSAFVERARAATAGSRPGA